MDGVVNIEDLRKLAKKRLPKIAYDFIEGGTDDEVGLVTNEQAFRKAGWVTFREVGDTNHVLPLAGRTYDEYLADRPGKLRTTLKRKTGKVETQVLTHFDDAAWQSYEAIYQESWKPSEGSYGLASVRTPGPIEIIASSGRFASTSRM